MLSSIKRISLLIAILAAGLQPTLASEISASAESVRVLLELTESEKLVEATMAQVDSHVKGSMQQALAGQPLSDNQQEILGNMRTKMMAMFEEEMDWKVLEPIMLEVYQKSFSQAEVDGMIAFYRTEAGRAVIVKMPLVMQNTMQAIQGRMNILMPKIQALQQETIAQLKAEPAQ